jgi:hypothetical protein
MDGLKLDAYLTSLAHQHDLNKLEFGMTLEDEQFATAVANCPGMHDESPIPIHDNADASASVNTSASGGVVMAVMKAKHKKKKTHTRPVRKRASVSVSRSSGNRGRASSAKNNVLFVASSTPPSFQMHASNSADDVVNIRRRSPKKKEVARAPPQPRPPSPRGDVTWGSSNDDVAWSSGEEEEKRLDNSNSNDISRDNHVRGSMGDIDSVLHELQGMANALLLPAHPHTRSSSSPSFSSPPPGQYPDTPASQGPHRYRVMTRAERIAAINTDMPREVKKKFSKNTNSTAQLTDRLVKWLVA